MGYLLNIIIIISWAVSTVAWATAKNISYTDKLDFQVRFDQRSNRNERFQYRLRYYPSLQLDASVSLNSMIVTGEHFNASHNSLDGSSNYIYARRLFVRKQYEHGKTEIGAIPTYKGRISSSGLSKDGWVTGARHVYISQAGNALELVVGRLESLDPAHALDWPENLNYFELEYSANIDRSRSMELSIERMLSGNFIRTEYRQTLSRQTELALEFIQRLDSNQSKFVTGLTGTLRYPDNPLEYGIYYAYSSQDFGPRAELTEDFIGNGHSLSLELEGKLSRFQATGWFVRIDLVENTQRLLTGIVIKL
ncbi:hypothetical protein [Salinimonas chungwhensis]|uniref:hypothetical protein n=1 Tax=Salinimonas chungwhensis TaxID=265425 RepID=UPI0003695800|nr:hypothetical protein [Salinimonas chungwhensis]